MIIVGAGLAGLIAAHAWPNARVLEAAPLRAAPAHQALLRFRSDAVARLTGIEFRRVTVRKGVWDTEAQCFAPPDILSANLYALKCLGRLAAERSIWNVEPVERFIAPPDFYAQLLEVVGGRIMWNATFDFPGARGHTTFPIVSTAPLSVAYSATFGEPAEGVGFHRAAITVERFRVPDADVYQTVYFPSHEHSVYRASITGDLLIVERAGPNIVERAGWLDATDAAYDAGLDDVCAAFGLSESALQAISRAGQQYGKIAPIDDSVRKRMMFRLTHERGIFSLGRFATWRNILLDDVVDDIAVIKRLIRAGHAYDTARANA
jgi:hypothetical protein